MALIWVAMTDSPTAHHGSDRPARKYPSTASVPRGPLHPVVEDPPEVGADDDPVDGMHGMAPFHGADTWPASRRSRLRSPPDPTPPRRGRPARRPPPERRPPGRATNPPGGRADPRRGLSPREVPREQPQRREHERLDDHHRDVGGAQGLVAPGCRARSGRPRAAESWPSAQSIPAGRRPAGGRGHGGAGGGLRRGAGAGCAAGDSERRRRRLRRGRGAGLHGREGADRIAGQTGDCEPMHVGRPEPAPASLPSPTGVESRRESRGRPRRVRGRATPVTSLPHARPAPPAAAATGSQAGPERSHDVG